MELDVTERARGCILRAGLTWTAKDPDSPNVSILRVGMSMYGMDPSITAATHLSCAVQAE
eukprot:m.247608 g.247608  ORF g.247608 m.247608 type:complete len:60 (+) comp15396_c0_seq1:2130-2309(+)